VVTIAKRTASVRSSVVSSAGVEVSIILEQLGATSSVSVRILPPGRDKAVLKGLKPGNYQARILVRTIDGRLPLLSSAARTFKVK
jgi:hypothetical protein